MATNTEKSSESKEQTSVVVDNILAIPVKTTAAQMTNVENLASKFLSHSYPSWKTDCNTYMIPPIFEVKGSKSLIGMEDKLPYSDPGDYGESIVYSLLKKLGSNKTMGMFVVHGFKLYKVLKWNNEYAGPLPIKGDATKECDFIVFHHSLGVIHIEVKNCSDNVGTIHKSIKKACEQLQRGKDLVDGFVEPINLMHWEVICLPSTKKSLFLANNIQSKYPGIRFLLADDVGSIEAFERWWEHAFEVSSCMSVVQTQAYEMALSYIIMVCHLTPMSESDYVIELSTALNSYTHLKQISHLHPQNFRDKYPNIVRWYTHISTCDSYASADSIPIIEVFEKKLLQKNNGAGLSALNTHLKNNKCVVGEVPSVLDKKFMDIIKSKHLISFQNIVRFYNNIKCMCDHTEKSHESPEVVLPKLDSVEDINNLELELCKCAPFINGSKPGMRDFAVFRLLSQKFCIANTHAQIVLTPDQLAIFEGSKKQLIIGGPGSGKTELLKAKCKQLALEIKAAKTEEKILYIIATGSPSGDPLLSYEMKNFFNRFPSVNVKSITIEEENPDHLTECVKELRELMTLKLPDGLPKYGHVFVDEYWIGCKPAEHEIILELVQNIPKYVWISSVFDYLQDHPKAKLRTGPLLKTLEEVGGCVSRIHQIVRGTDSIITLEKGYSALYQMRSYPYGTKKMYGHSLEGLPIKWKCAKDITSMYRECVLTVQHYTAVAIPDADQFPNFPKKTLNPANILVVDFSVRSKASHNVIPTIKEQLLASNIPTWSFGENMENFMDRTKLTLLCSKTRTESTYLDGMEWPLVIVILPSEILLNKDVIAVGAERLRNYDTYISFFRAQVQLVVISDKWKSEKEFLDDIAAKEK